MSEYAADDDSKPNGERSDDDILKEARSRYAACQEADGDNRTNALDDLRFLSGGDAQWPERALAARKLDGRPIITVNVLPNYIHQVTNDQRQNTPSIKVHPVGDKADIETAKVRQGMIRHIEYDSNADTAYDTSVNSAAGIGFGYFRLVTDYDGLTSFNQKIMFQRIRNALSVRIDPLSVEADGSDQNYSFIECICPREEFKREWPDAIACSQTTFSDGTSAVAWLTDLSVLVCEYYCIEVTKATVVLLTNGETGYKDELVSMPPGVTIKSERPGEKRKVMLYKITGVDVLERTEIKCKWIPVFPVYGDEIDIEGKVIRSGMIRNAKGPCQSYNVMTSGATEEIALRTKAPYIGVEGQFEDHEDEWEQANNRAFPYLEYAGKSVDGHLAPPPQRQPMADIPSGYLALKMHAGDDIKKTFGLFDASIGARGTATSGKQEIAQQREGDMANSHYMDGLIRTIRHCGRCIDCMIPNYYDWQGVAKIMREDGSVDHAQINEPSPTGQTDERGNPIMEVMNDMTCGEYSITVSAGPNYSTARQDSAEFFTNAMSAAKDPATASVVTYLAMKNQDAPGADVATEMLATLLPPPAKAVLDKANGDGEEEPQPMVETPKGSIPVPQAGQMIAELMQGLQQAQEQLQKADATKQQTEALKQQHIMTEQGMEPQRQAIEGRKIDAELAKANAAIEQAKAATIAAQADLARAQAEAACAPQKAQMELIKAQAEANIAPVKAQTELVNAEAAARLALQPPEPDEPTETAEAEPEPPPMPKGMTITAPSGATYEVTLH